MKYYNEKLMNSLYIKSLNIVEEFPELFKTSLETDFGNGWYDLVKDVCVFIRSYNSKHPDACIGIRQVKEKFVGLRIYINRGYNGFEEVHDKLVEIENMSHRICEFTGKPGRVAGNRWKKTLNEELARLYDDHEADFFSFLEEAHIEGLI